MAMHASKRVCGVTLRHRSCWWWWWPTAAQGDTALHVAAAMYSDAVPSILSMLVAAGADVDAKSDKVCVCVCGGGGVAHQQQQRATADGKAR